MSTVSIKPYSILEERLNAITHGAGFIAAFVGLFLLLSKANTITSVVSVSIYGSSLMLMFLASTIYHSVSNPRLKSTMKLLDHSAIYLLIAGTYTPFMLVALDNFMGVIGTVMIWSIAVFGLIFKWVAGHRFPKISVALYLLMGWLVILFVYPLSKVVDANGLWLLLAGGAFYSIGVIFYVKKQVAYTHAIWHCFVIAGCACHYISIYVYIV
jgi:hemolysin III